ncbi:MAG: hypothetical protein FWG25_00775 [Promicromonosporaceae bacterium]|nr:hypothetical protein [Promicromonosporaceae bacterium]
MPQTTSTNTASGAAVLEPIEFTMAKIDLVDAVGQDVRDQLEDGASARNNAAYRHLITLIGKDVADEFTAAVVDYYYDGPRG